MRIKRELREAAARRLSWLAGAPRSRVSFVSRGTAAGLFLAPAPMFHVEQVRPPFGGAPGPPSLASRDLSEERPLGRDPVPAGETVRTGVPLSEGAVVEALVDQPDGLQSELPQGPGGPPGELVGVVGARRGGGWLGDDEPPVDPQERRPALGDHG